MLDQFDRLRRRNAFLEQYKKEKMFENGLEEFDDARYVPDIHVSGPPGLTSGAGRRRKSCSRSIKLVKVRIISHMYVYCAHYPSAALIR